MLSATCSLTHDGQCQEVCHEGQGGAAAELNREVLHRHGQYAGPALLRVRDGQLLVCGVQQGEKLLLAEEDLSTSVPCSAFVASKRYYPATV
jgi:hypothetical protein